MGKVITIDTGLHQPVEVQGQHDFVPALEALIERAKRGEISGLLCIVENSDGSVDFLRRITTLDNASKLYARAAYKIQQEIDKATYSTFE